MLDEGGAERNIGEFISQYLTRNLEALEVKRVVEVPSDFVITAELVMPELVALRDNFGKVQIPGLGWKPVVELNYRERDIHFVKIRAAVELAPEELKQVTEWPFTDLIIATFAAAHVAVWSGWGKPTGRTISPVWKKL